MPHPSHAKSIFQWLTSALTNHRNWSGYLAPFKQWLRPEWQPNTYGARVCAVRTESDRVNSYSLKIDRRWPGFTAGQHVALLLELNGRQYWRTFSLSHAPSHWQQTGLLELTIQTQTDGTVTPQLPKRLLVGTRIRISAAQGQFKAPAAGQSALMIAGGSGITPIRAMLHEIALTRPEQDITLMYYNENRAPLFEPEWLALQASMPHFKAIMIDTAQSGLINPQQLLTHCPDLCQREVLVCGPPGLMAAASQQLMALGLNPRQLHQESFGQPNRAKSAAPKADQDPVEVYFANSEKSIQSQGQQTLLHLAEQANTQPNSGCRAGICHQCTCRKLKGLVYNTLTQQHSDTGPEDIQLCVSVPVGPVSLEL